MPVPYTSELQTRTITGEVFIWYFMPIFYNKTASGFVISITKVNSQQNYSLLYDFFQTPFRRIINHKNQTVMKETVDLKPTPENIMQENLEGIMPGERNLDKLPIALTVGGTGGKYWSDGKSGRITKVSVRCGAEVDAIKLTWENGEGEWHGGTDGKEVSWNVPENEKIVKIKGRCGSRIDQLQFITDRKTMSPVFGGDGGNEFNIDAGSNELISINGKAGKRIDQLTFNFYTQC